MVTRPPRIHNLFISHSWKYSGQYDNLEAMLDAAPRFFYNNHSVPRNSAIHTSRPGRQADRQLREAIYNRMRGCHVVILLGGVYATHSRWMSIEIDLADEGFAQSKPIIAIKPRGNTLMSSTVRKAADEVVNWNTNSIVGAIRKLSRA